MRSRDSDQRRKFISATVSKAIGCDVEFPFGVPVHESFIKAAYDDKETCQKIYTASGNDPRILSLFLFKKIGEREMVTEPKPKNEFSVSFFITSPMPLNWLKLKTPDGSPFLYVFGGMCMQRIIHYHFVVVCSHYTTAEALETANDWNINAGKVITSIKNCEEYIKMQLVEQPTIIGNVDETFKKTRFTSNFFTATEPIARGDRQYIKIVDNIENKYPECDIYTLNVEDYKIVKGEKPYSGQPGVKVVSNVQLTAKNLNDILENMTPYCEYIWAASVNILH